MEMEPYRDWAEEAHAGHPLTYTAVGIFSFLHEDIFKTENAVTICCHPGSSIAILGNQHSASNVIVRNCISRVFDISQDVLRLTGIYGLEKTDHGLQPCSRLQRGGHTQWYQCSKAMHTPWQTL